MAETNKEIYSEVRKLLEQKGLLKAKELTNIEKNKLRRKEFKEFIKNKKYV